MESLPIRITVDPAICHGKPCIRGLRYPVEVLLDLLAADMTAEEILADYPDLKRDDIRAALVYAAQVTRVQRMVSYPRERAGWCTFAAACGALIACTKSRYASYARSGEWKPYH